MNEELFYIECTICGVEKPMTDFRKNKSMTTGRLRQCKKCLIEEDRVNMLDPSWREKRAKGRRDRARHRMHNDPAYYKKMREYYNSKAKERREDSEYKEKEREKDRIHKRKKRLDEDYRELEKERNREWRKNKYATDADFRAATKARALERKCLPQAKVVLASLCAYCGEKENLSMEHIIPISFNDKHNISKDIIGSKFNITTACRSCNSSKRDSICSEEPFITFAKLLTGTDFINSLPEEKFWRAEREKVLV